MSNARTLIAQCLRLGVELRPTPHGTLKVKALVPLPENLRQELRQRRSEVLPLVKAMNWLRSRLITPEHIAPLLADWLGTIDQPTGRNIDALIDARWALGIDAYIGDDGRLWWRLPRGTVQ
jgi:hypothetical protein